MKKIYLFLLLGLVSIIATSIVIVRLRSQQSSGHDIHYHAGIKIYVDGKPQDFSSIRYMSITPCGEEKHDSTPEEKQLQKAHFHEGIDDVVHVHAEGATWGDLIKNIKLNLDSSKEVAGYSNENTKIEDILNTPIVADESIVIVVGDQSSASAYLKDKVTIDHIKEVEKMSELCGDSSS